MLKTKLQRGPAPFLDNVVETAVLVTVLAVGEIDPGEMLSKSVIFQPLENFLVSLIILKLFMAIVVRMSTSSFRQGSIYLDDPYRELCYF